MREGLSEVEKGDAQRSLTPSQKRLLDIVQAAQSGEPMTPTQTAAALEALAKWAGPQLTLLYGDKSRG